MADTDGGVEEGASRDDEHVNASRDGEHADAGVPPHDERAGVPLESGESGTQAFMRALKVARNGKVGVAVGLLFTAGVFVLFVVIPGSYRSPLWYLALGFVLTVSTAGLVAFVLTLVRAIRLSRDL